MGILKSICILWIPNETPIVLLSSEYYQRHIDNDTERAVRPLATQRNSMLHFGSDEGAKRATTYHSIISTVKLQGRSAWDYLGKFYVKSLIKRIESSLLEFLSVKTLSNEFNGCRDFFSLRPGNIGLATCQHFR